MIKEPRIMKTESDAYEENASSLFSPSKTSATPAINAVTGNGKVSDTQRYIMNKNNVNTFLPGVPKPSAKKYNSKLMKDTISTPAENFLKVEFKYSRYRACCLSLESKSSA